MKQRIFLLIGILIGVGLQLIAAAQTSFTNHLSFNPNEVSVNLIDRDGNTYSYIQLTEQPSYGAPGCPVLPLVSFMVSVPTDADNFTIKCNTLSETRIQLDYAPVPGDVTETTSGFQMPEVTSDLAPAYYSDGVFPTEKAIVANDMILFGFNHVITIAVRPMAWDPIENVIFLSTEMEITLKWDSHSNSSVNLIYPKAGDTTQERMDRIRDLVVNPEDVNSYAYDGKSNQMKAERSNNWYPYVIVTPRAFANSVERLAAIRRVRGIQPKITYIEDILDDTLFSNGDELSGINDDAGKLRAFLRYAYEMWGTSDVVLVGDETYIPIRWAKTILSSDDSKNSVYVSDAYFTDLTTPWTLDNRGRQVVNNLPGVSYTLNVGRIPCRYDNELENYIDKVIQYEFNTCGVDRSYLDNSFIFFCWDDSLHDTYYVKENKATYEGFMPYLKYSFNRYGEQRSGHSLINEMNENQWGFVDFRAHGHYGGFETYRITTPKPAKYYGVNAIDADKAWYEAEAGNGLDNWNNKNYPCWSLSISCSVAELGLDRDEITLTKSFLLGRNYGGVVFMGHTSEGYKTESTAMVNNIYKVLVNNHNIKLNPNFAGDLMTEGKIATRNPAGVLDYPEKVNDIYWRHVHCTMGLFGDPLVPLYGKRPYAICDETGNFCPENEAMLKNLRLGIHNIDSESARISKTTLTSSATHLAPANTSYLFYRPDMEPYFLPTHLKNLHVDNDKYIFVSNLLIDNNTENNQFGLRVDDDTKCTIESLGETYISRNIEANPGSHLIFKVHGGFNTANCQISGSGSVSVDCDKEILLDEGAFIQQGVEVTFNINTSND